MPSSLPTLPLTDDDRVAGDPPFRVTAIGSCRVHGPLRLAAQEGDFALNQSGVYGYCHTSAEAVQQIDVLQGRRELPAHLLPVVAPRVAEGARARGPHVLSDFYMVELSSAKHLSIDGVQVQLNYFTRHLASFFDDVDRTRQYWRLVRAGEARDLRRFVNTDPTAKNLSTADRYLLANLRMHQATEEAITADACAILSRVPDAVFVTHFDAVDSAGDRIPARHDFVRMARRALSEAGAPMFDPSDEVASFGQDDAVDASQGSLSHYTPAFEAVLARQWTAHCIAPSAARAAERRAQLLAQPDASDDLLFA